MLTTQTHYNNARHEVLTYSALHQAPTKCSACGTCKLLRAGCTQNDNSPGFDPSSTDLNDGLHASKGQADTLRSPKSTLLLGLLCQLCQVSTGGSLGATGGSGGLAQCHHTRLLHLLAQISHTDDSEFIPLIDECSTLHGCQICCR